MTKCTETEFGAYLTENGISHYECSEVTPLSGALIDALEHCPKGPSWFWWEDTPAVIYPRDDELDLYYRWIEWRTAYEADPIAINLLFMFMASPEITRRLPEPIRQTIMKSSTTKKGK